MLDLFFACDFHCSDNPPSSRIDNYRDSILNKVEWIVDKVIEYDGYFVFLGDWFHRKKPEHVSHFLVNRLISILKKLPSGKSFAILGNHDIFPVDSQDAFKSPIHTLHQAGLIKLLVSKPIALSDGSGVKVSLNGCSWSEPAEVRPELFELPHLNCQFHVSVFHQYVIPDLTPFAAHHLKISQVAPFVPAISLYGHFHDGFEDGCVTFNHKKFYNVGSVARAKATKENLSRQLKLGHLRFDGEDVSFFTHIIPSQPANEVFDLMKRDKQVLVKAQIEQFVKQFSAQVEAISDTDLSSLEELLGLVTQLKLDKTITDKVKQLLEQAFHEVQ